MIAVSFLQPWMTCTNTLTGRDERMKKIEAINAGTQTIIQIMPNDWIAEELLIAVTGWRKGTIARARKKSWLIGQEYRHFSPEGDPKPNSECVYNLESINRWIKKQPQPGAQKE